MTTKYTGPQILNGNFASCLFALWLLNSSLVAMPTFSAGNGINPTGGFEIGNGMVIKMSAMQNPRYS